MVARVAELTQKQREGITGLCERFHVRRLAAFGSAVTGGFQPTTSDYDFSVEFERVPSLRSADQYFGLKEAMELLLGRSVDLVVDRAVRNRFFRQELDETSVEVYAA
jgi:uncharacterized protein